MISESDALLKAIRTVYGPDVAPTDVAYRIRFVPEGHDLDGYGVGDLYSVMFPLGGETMGERGGLTFHDPIVYIHVETGNAWRFGERPPESLTAKARQ